MWCEERALPLCMFLTGEMTEEEWQGRESRTECSQ